MNCIPPSTTSELVALAAKTFGASTFIEEGPVRIDFADFNRRCDLVAKALLAIGLRHGDRIAVWAPNIHEWIVAALGAQSMGAVLVTINTRYKVAEAAYILRASGARVLFTIGDFLGTDLRAQQLVLLLAAVAGLFCRFQLGFELRQLAVLQLGHLV